MDEGIDGNLNNNSTGFCIFFFFFFFFFTFCGGSGCFSNFKVGVTGAGLLSKWSNEYARDFGIDQGEMGGHDWMGFERCGDNFYCEITFLSLHGFGWTLSSLF